MLQPCSLPLGTRRKGRRPVLSSSTSLRIPRVRPSLLDCRFTGDAWVIDQGDGTLAVRLGDYNLSQITGLALDVPSLNQLLDRVWHRRPRPR
jgi:hypothetical protein